jgi:hypothetical protein
MGKRVVVLKVLASGLLLVSGKFLFFICVLLYVYLVLFCVNTIAFYHHPPHHHPFIGYVFSHLLFDERDYDDDAVLLFLCLLYLFSSSLLSVGHSMISVVINKYLFFIKLNYGNYF